jgi:hypothetical protein
MKISVFWVVALSSLVDVNQRFRGHTASIIRAMSMKISVFFVVALCSLVDVNQRFIGHQGDIHRPDDRGSMTFETFVNIDQTIQRNNTEDRNIHINRCENLKSYIIYRLLNNE